MFFLLKGYFSQAFYRQAIPLAYSSDLLFVQVGNNGENILGGEAIHKNLTLMDQGIALFLFLDFSSTHSHLTRIDSGPLKPAAALTD